MVEIKLDGKIKNLSEFTYDIFALDSKKIKGDHEYDLSVNLEEFSEKFRPMYEDEMPHMRDSLLEDSELKTDYGENDWPSYDSLLKNEKLLSKIILDWYEHSIIDIYLKDLGEKNLNWCILSMDKVNIVDDKISIKGTAKKYVSNKSFRNFK